MREELKKIYYADDGTVFDDRTVCEKYEADLALRAKQTSYWAVRHSPDLTEGRGHCGILYAEAYINATYPTSEIWMIDWCIKTFGRKVAFVQGVSPMENWTLRKIEREEFLRCQDAWIGSTRMTPKKVKLALGSGEHGLLEVPNDG